MMLRKDMFLEVRGERKACVWCVAALAAVTAAAADLAVTCETNAAPSGAQALPTGAGNFTVELPQTTGGATVRAADFGFSSTNDANQEAITRAAEECRRVGAARLELAPGVYRCFGTNGVRLIGLKDVTIDGRGALLVFRRPAAGARPNFHIRNCERVELKDFTMDWDWATDPLGDFVEVMGTHVGEKADNSSYFDVRFPGMDRHPVYPNPMAVADFNPMTMTPDGKIAFRDAFKTSDGNEILGDLHSGSLGAKSEWLSPCTLRVWPHVRAETGVRNATWNGFFRPDWNQKVVRDKVKVGATYRLLHYYYGEGGFVMDSNAHLTLRDITVWSCRGHGFCVSGSQHHWQLLNVRLEPPEGTTSPSRRVVTATSDGTHVVQSNGYCLYDGCVFRMTNDDTWNFHDVTSPVRRRDARTLVCVSPYGTARVRAKSGDVVELAEKDFTPIPWRGRIVSVAKDAFTVDTDLPEGDEIRLLFDRSHATTHVHFRNCLVEDTHFRGLIYAHDTTVENCTFRRTGGHSLSFEVYYNLERSAEGSGVTNVVVRGCTFEESERRLNYSDSATIRTTATVNPRSVAPKTLHRGVFGQFLVENNRFVNPRGMCLKMNAVRDLVFRNNDIVLKNFRGNQRYTQGWLGFENSENVRIEGNRWHVSPSVTNAPAIRLEGDCPQFFQAVNRTLRTY